MVDERALSGGAVAEPFEEILKIDEDAVRSENPAELKRLWSEWVAKMGTEEASRRWLAIFAATDASPTG